MKLTNLVRRKLIVSSIYLLILCIIGLGISIYNIIDGYTDSPSKRINSKDKPIEQIEPKSTNTPKDDFDIIIEKIKEKNLSVPSKESGTISAPVVEKVEKVEKQKPTSNTTSNPTLDKPKQKMVRYEDWVDEPNSKDLESRENKEVGKEIPIDVVRDLEERDD